MTGSMILSLIPAIVAAILAITLHEAAHGYAALAMGDDTARQAGRLSLNPLRHVDRVGTILLPGFLLISQLIAFQSIQVMFGWAKPVPVAAWRFRDPRRGMMFVAAAGPAMNFFLAWLGALGFYLVPLAGLKLAGMLAGFLYIFMLSNIGLGLFNLLPIPPLDGGRIMVGLLPALLADRWARIERGGLLFVLLLVVVVPRLSSSLGYDFDPVQWIMTSIGSPLLRLFLTLAGDPPAGWRAIFGV